MNVKVTFYGYPDNEAEPGVLGSDVIAQSLSGRHKNGGDPVAGGVGTFFDPITAAVSKGNTVFPVGSILYMPHISKYLIVEDECRTCVNDKDEPVELWVDVWLDSDSATATAAILTCEDAWTGDMTAFHEVSIETMAGRTIDLNPLFDKTTQTCNAP